MNAMKVGLERVGAVVGTLLLAFALLLVNSPVRAASYVATDASSTTSSVITSASDSGAEMSVGSAVLYVIVGATALTVVIGVVLLIVGPCGHKHRSARSRKIRK
jgi:hypothetical protein